MTTKIKLKDNSDLNISKITDEQINIELIYIQNKKSYQTKYDLEDLQEYFESKKVTIQDFIKISKNNNTEVIKSKNEREILLVSNINGQKLTIPLKENQNQTQDIYDKPMSPIENNNNNILNLEEEILKLQKEYDEKITKIKEENEILIKENNELKKSLDEEKRKNDEIVRVYLENREKYEEATKRNKNISELQSKL